MWVAQTFAGATIIANISWPLAQGQARTWITIVGVITFFLCSTLHCASSQTPKFTVTLLGLIPMAFIVEAIGVHTQFPFGHYAYGDQLGPSLANVPLLIPLAWVMMLYPAYLAARFLSAKPTISILLGAWLMATWDLYLDPQMIHEHYWTWFTASGEPTLNIPLSNFAGWFAVSALFMWLLHKSDGSKESSSEYATPQAMPTAPAIMLLWVWLGSFVANIVPFSPYLDRPSVALAGLIGMGIVLGPWSWRLWSSRS